MAGALRVQVEVGLRGKKVVAVATDWPGLSRGAKTGADAIDRLVAYRPRYTAVAKLAGMEQEFAAQEQAEVVEEYVGTGSTDFWGISFAFSDIDKHVMSSDELDRGLTLMRACWSFFDQVRARVSVEMQKGPRGGGKNRDQIVQHTIWAELDFSKRVGITPTFDELLADEGLRAYRDAYVAAIREFHAEGKPARKWPIRYLIRHTAFHTMDHAWEMEDKDLTAR